MRLPKDACQIIYYLSNDKVPRVLWIGMANRARSVRQADVAKIDQKQEARSFAHIHKDG